MNILALDIGGTAIKSAIVRPDGQRTDRREAPSEGRKGGPTMMRNALELAASYLASAALSPGSSSTAESPSCAPSASSRPAFDRIAISVTGQVNPADGSILFANDNVPGFTGMKVRDLFAERFGVPVTVMNDVNAAALGEAHFGAGAGQPDFVCLTYGTGVGGAIVMGGRIYTGSQGAAGELGHMVTHPDGLACMCGQIGCYEQYASTTALLRTGAAKHADYADARRIFRLRAAGDAFAEQLLAGWIHEICLGLVNICHIFNPALLVLGGGILQEPGLVDEISAHLYPMIMPSFRTVSIRAASLGNDAGLMGAAVQSLQTLQSP